MKFIISWKRGKYSPMQCASRPPILRMQTRVPSLGRSGWAMHKCPVCSWTFSQLIANKNISHVSRLMLNTAFQELLYSIYPSAWTISIPKKRNSWTIGFNHTILQPFTINFQEIRILWNSMKMLEFSRYNWFLWQCRIILSIFWN